jgi:5-aminolevulinate synthase
MESLLNQSRAMCPFLKRTCPASLRALSTTTRPSTSPGGGTISNLQVIARRCPVMSKALAVQSSRLASARRFTAGSVGANFGVAPGLKAFNSSVTGTKNLHTTAGNGASIATETYEKDTRGITRLFFSS